MPPIIGQYVPGDSIVHRLDPRSKLLAVFIFIIVIFLADNFISYGMITIFVAAAIMLSRVPFAFVLRGLKFILILVIITFLLHLFLTKEGDVIYQIGSWNIYSEGLIQGTFISLRLLYLVIFTSLLTLTTTPIEITDGLESLMNPLKRLRVPVHEFALMMSIALRFIPTLLEEAEKIMKAQSARGVDFTSGPFKERLKSIVPLLIPLFVSSFKRAEDLALAMEARGYRGGEGRTKLRILTWGMKENVLMLLLALLTGALVWIRWF